VFLTYANQLTILRLIFVPCFVVLIVYGHIAAATLLFVLAGITDGLDGLIARKLGQRTALGSYLDPMADKLLLTAAFVTLSIPSLPLAVHIPVWLTILTISRDLLIALSALIIHLKTGHSEFPPSMLGKWTTAFELVTVGLGLLANFSGRLVPDAFRAGVFVTLALVLASGLHYAYRSAQLIEGYQQGSNRGASRN
jgi:cardiolipin synthase (CMP-forming)